MDFTLVGLWQEMGPTAKTVVIILLIMSMYALGITVERLMTFRRGKAQSQRYIATLAPLVGATGRLREALGLEQKFPGSPVARVIGSGVKEYVRATEAVQRQRRAPGQPTGGFDIPEAVNRTMERVKERELAGLRRGLPVLATVASSAPFVGLFGTVGGIITAFQKLADPTRGGGGIGSVSAGIAEALITTAVGLAVAIIAVWFYNFFTNKVDDLTLDIDETASELCDSIIRETDGIIAEAAAG
ncbi:MAG TPA: MotA/TolQ/ExbB proton channel family protein [Polyangia bacterium]|jgi:biopolymer transport protein ExbB/TolQ|nr:MotA/TolQ/ExbB proton channel family protein [Polyangia bacterium]